MDDEEDVLKMLINDGYDDDDDLNFEIDSEAEARLLEGDVITSNNLSDSNEINKNSQSETNSSFNKDLEITNQSNSSPANGENDKIPNQSSQNRPLLKRPYTESTSNRNSSTNNFRNQFKRPRFPNNNKSVNVQNEFFKLDKNAAFKYPAHRSSNSSLGQKSGPIYRFPSMMPSPSLLPPPSLPSTISNMSIDPILTADLFNNPNNNNFFQRSFGNCSSFMNPRFDGFSSSIIPNPFNPPPINIMPFVTNPPFINGHPLSTPNKSFVGFSTNTVPNNQINNFKQPLISNNIPNSHYNFPDHSNRQFNHNVNNMIHPLKIGNIHHGNSLLPDPPLMRPNRNLTVLNQSNLNNQQQRTNFFNTLRNQSNIDSKTQNLIKNQEQSVNQTPFVQNRNLKTLTTDATDIETSAKPNTNLATKPELNVSTPIISTISSKEIPNIERSSKPIRRKKKKKKGKKPTQQTQNQSVIAEKVEEIKDSFGIDEEYMKKMEEQKILREKIAQERAEKRKIFQTVCSGGDVTPIIRQSSSCNEKNLEQSTTNPQVTKITPAAKNVSTLKTPTPIANMSSPEKITTATTTQAIKPSSSIQISGLAVDIRESLLRKITRPYGMVESIVFIEQNNESKCAIVKFIQSNDAKKFMDSFRTDPTKLKQTLMSDKLPTLTFLN
nr:probable ATP-dependent RNA helicase ddx42 isoform X2 [Dermatophagoides pteronyssinus]XP_027204171.1 probable ATP-dependent RNA helicase ddx42 isoform X3 [Dermatophagoides pteronyssinus]XP_027204172.1 probable ATP-dependent RNA helicase ddx42 isoform X4 [Dermatophagoides pteronyssinus]